jgi:Questin oxidase-like
LNDNTEQMSEVMLDALDRLRGTGPEFEGFLANHGPMAAEALVRLGADEQVAGWVDGYRVRLDVAPGTVGVPAADDWRQHLGDVRLLGDWTEHLRRSLQEAPWQEALTQWWARLLPGMAASAAHGLIRTAHAVRMLASAGDDPHPLLVDELAQGLALWAARYQLLPGAPRLSGTDDAGAAVRGLPRLGPDVPSAGPGITGRFVPLDSLTGLPAALDRWSAPADDDQALDHLISAAARVLAARDDAPIAFCHAVTAPAAVRLVLPFLSPSLRVASVAASWQVIGAIVAGFGSPRLEAEASEPRVAEVPDRSRLVTLAVEHGDEHVIKLTEAALREHARSGDATLLIAADRFRGRVPSPG